MENERDRLSTDNQENLSDSDQIFSQDSFNLHSFLHRNQHDLVDTRSEFLHGTSSSQTDHRQLHDYQDYIQRQTSSDEDQPYICERCRQETSAEKNDQIWSNKNDSTDNTNESLRNWLTNVSSHKITQDSINTHDFQNDRYFYDLPSMDKNRRYTSEMYNLDEEFDNVNDSSRESQNPYQRDYHQYRHLHHRARSPLVNKTVPHGVAL
ncbi:uncharacterized protein [Bombus fervidus]|uniref:uncharacterized protein n=1 Tax=Bombus fervidus TaxID=203811 RepID=UPI003D18FB92